MNAETFEAWLEHHLLPTLRSDIVVLDNLKLTKPKCKSCQKNCTYDTCRHTAHFNPIEMHFQTEKRAAKFQRTVVGLLAILGCAALFNPSKYSHTPSNLNTL